ncbi:MAG: hypothetical protein AAF645_13205, partial [Myxococcota bacterium]
MHHFRVLPLLLLLACGDDASIEDASPGQDQNVDVGSRDERVAEQGMDAEPTDAADDRAVEGDAAVADNALDVPDATTPDRCLDALFCDTFEAYGVRELNDDERFGSWLARQRNTESLFELSDARSFSGETALHVRIEPETRDGARLFLSDEAAFEGNPVALHGRLMMYVAENGVSNHWTWGGVLGSTPSDSDVPDLRSTYLFSSLRSADQNRISTVNYINATPPRDCWRRSETNLPEGRWVCISWSVDGDARRIEMTMDDGDAPFLTMNETGDGCVGDVA